MNFNMNFPGLKGVEIEQVEELQPPLDRMINADPILTLYLNHPLLRDPPLHIPIPKVSKCRPYGYEDFYDGIYHSNCYGS